MPSHPPRIDRFGIDEEIGEGTAAVVYRAFDTANNAPVALKLLREMPTRETVKRFVREGRTTAAIRHPNVVSMYEMGTHKGRLFIVMELIDGHPIDLRGPQKEVLTHLYKIALALDEVHRHGIIHRDLKPGNILVDKQGEPKLVDFGLAHMLGVQPGQELTRSGQVIGTPAYMAPEQVFARRTLLGPATDVYALGAMVYEILTGKPAYEGKPEEVMEKLRKGPPPDPGGPPALVALCVKSMSRDVSRRHPRATAWATELKRHLDAQ